MFGGTSSPSCSNYFLKSASVNGKDKFELEAAKILPKIFYVDKILKSVEQKDQVIHLIKNVEAM